MGWAHVGSILRRRADAVSGVLVALVALFVSTTLCGECAPSRCGGGGPACHPRITTAPSPSLSRLSGEAAGGVGRGAGSCCPVSSPVCTSGAPAHAWLRRVVYGNSRLSLPPYIPCSALGSAYSSRCLALPRRVPSELPFRRVLACSTTTTRSPRCARSCLRPCPAEVESVHLPHPGLASHEARTHVRGRIPIRVPRTLQGSSPRPTSRARIPLPPITKAAPDRHAPGCVGGTVEPTCRLHLQERPRRSTRLC